MQTLRKILEMIRFSHTVFALPFAALATVMALAAPLPSGAYPVFRLRDIVGILLCMVFARSAAMAFNRLVDAKIDAENPRTAGRHLPAGVLSRNEVWAFTFLCSAAFIASTALFRDAGVSGADLPHAYAVWHRSLPQVSPRPRRCSQSAGITVDTK